MNEVLYFQIGKSGVTPGVLRSLSLALKDCYQVRISILKSFGRNRSNVKELAEEIRSKIDIETGKECYYRIIGFTIILGKTKINKK